MRALESLPIVPVPAGSGNGLSLNLNGLEVSYSGMFIRSGARGGENQRGGVGLHSGMSLADRADGGRERVEGCSGRHNLAETDSWG